MRRQNLKKAKKDLENGKIKGKSDLAKAKEQLEVSQQTLTNGEAEIKENTQKLLDAKEEIKKNKIRLIV